MTDATNQPEPDMEYTFIQPAPALPPAHAGAPPEPLRTFDLRTSEERLVMWCASLERRMEAQAQRITALELALHRQGNVVTEAQPSLFSEADRRAHRLLNPGEEEDAGDLAEMPP